MLNRRNISTPVYLVRETALRRNLDLIADVRRRAGVKIIMAFKANALWRTFHIMREIRHRVHSQARSTNCVSATSS